SHLRMAIQDRIERGEPPDQARRRALIDCSNRTLAKEETRSVWTWTAVEQLATDLQIGARILWRAPALRACAIRLIGLVIGGSSTVFSLVPRILPTPEPRLAAAPLVTI